MVIVAGLTSYGMEEPVDPNVRHRKMMAGGYEGKLEGTFQEPCTDGDCLIPWDDPGNTFKFRDMKKG